MGLDTSQRVLLELGVVQDLPHPLYLLVGCFRPLDEGWCARLRSHGDCGGDIIQFRSKFRHG
jgi:hypothetical protein